MKNMLITQISQQKNNEKRYSVFIDGEFMFGMSDVDLLYFKLAENQEITRERLDYILDNVIFTKARDKALNYLGFKARTVLEVRKKLKEQDYSEEIVERVMELLVQYNYVNDEQYARNFVSDKVEFKKLGKVRIKQELREKGVEMSIIEEVLGELIDDELQLAIENIEKKARGKTTLDEKERRRYFDFLVRKGFSFQTAKSALEIYLKNYLDNE